MARVCVVGGGVCGLGLAMMLARDFYEAEWMLDVRCWMLGADAGQRVAAHPNLEPRT